MTVTQRSRNVAKVVILAVVVLGLVGGLAAFRHVQTLSDDDVTVIQEHRERAQGEYRAVVDGNTVRVFDQDGTMVEETSTQDWRANREDYEERYDLGANGAASGR